MTAPTIPVLMLHGICDPVPDYATFAAGRTCLLEADDFRSLVKWCARNFDVIKGEHLDAIYSGAMMVRRPLLITFDDALASVIDFGVPVLQEHQVSALVFVTTDWTESGRAPFVFRLERRLYDAPPASITLHAGSTAVPIDIGSRSALPRALDTLWATLFAKRISPTHLRPDQVLLDGQPMTDTDASTDRVFWGPASWAELARAAAGRSIEIGSHLRSHRPLPWLDAEAQADELSGSRAVLQQNLGVDASICSYPHGMVDDRGQQIAARSYRWSFTNSGGIVTAGSPRTFAPRLHVPNKLWSRVKLQIRWPRLMRKVGQ